jgi:hypothetical protein
MLNRLKTHLLKPAAEPWLFFALFVLLGSCTVWKTDRSNAYAYDEKGDLVMVDDTRMRDGQPYYLPKGMIHLVISEGAAPKADTPKQEGADTKKGDDAKKDDGKKGGTPAPATAKSDAPAATPSMGAMPANEQSKEGKAGSYTVSAKVEFEADATAGLFYARYSPNWFFDDLTSIQVNSKRLLHSVKTQSDDKTLEIVNNLADTAANLIKTSGMMTVKRVGGEGERPGILPPKIHIKKLDINERFDPLDARDLARVEALFSDYTAGRHYKVFSPLRIEIRVAQTPRGKASNCANLAREGLWFREPCQVEIVLRRNPDLLEHVRSELTKVCDELEKQKDAYEKADKERLSLKEDQSERSAVVSGIITQASGAITELGKLRADLEKMYFESQPGAGAGAGTLSLVVASKGDPYTLGVRRSAFVKRTTELQIDNGVLMGVGHDKPSEILGFTKIPLSISEKILALPKAIFSSKTEVLTEKNKMLKQQSGGGTE